MGKRVLTTKSSDETKALGTQIAERLKNGGIVLLFGDLGSGKTTFTQGFAQQLGIKHHIISPTFILMRTYELPGERLGKLYHIDLYRIDSEKDIEGLGLSEVFEDPENIVVIEWAEKLGSMIPQRRTELRFTYMGEDHRQIEEEVYEN